MSSRSLNRATLIGRLGTDPEMRSTPQGSTVCTFSLATSERYKDKNGEWQEITDWHKIVIWDKLAEVAGQYLRKGSSVFIEGKIRTRSYDKDGITRYITEVIGQTMIMLGSKSEGSSYEHNNSYSQDTGNMSDHLVQDEPEDDIPF